jgi:hypothetical protein
MCQIGFHSYHPVLFSCLFAGLARQRLYPIAGPKCNPYFKVLPERAWVAEGQKNGGQKNGRQKNAGQKNARQRNWEKRVWLCPADDGWLTDF